MNRLFILLFILMCCSIVISACDEDEETNSSMTIDELTDVYTKEYCTKVFTCCKDAEIAEVFDGASVTDQQGCEQAWGQFFTMMMSEQQASIDKGRMQWDGNVASSCMTTYKNTSCTQLGSDLFPTDEMCGDPFIGLVAGGGACTSDGECVGDNFYCSGVDEEENTEGVCKALPGLGEECPDYWCAGDLMCTDSVCAVAEVPGPNEECPNYMCADGLFCDSSASPMTCLAEKNDGESCGDDMECKSYSCVEGVCYTGCRGR